MLVVATDDNDRFFPLSASRRGRGLNAAGPIEFLCECGADDCQLTVELTTSRFRRTDSFSRVNMWVRSTAIA
jgi:hypothetical protein